MDFKTNLYKHQYNQDTDVSSLKKNCLVLTSYSHTLYPHIIPGKQCSVVYHYSFVFNNVT